MNKLLLCAVVISGSIFLSGCYEDFFELTLNANGSGSFNYKVTFSEQMMVSLEEASPPGSFPACTKDKLLANFGSAVSIISATEQDTKDGGRVIEVKGSFQKPEDLFFSKFCEEQIKLKLSPANPGQARFSILDMFRKDITMTTRQMYGAAKGLFIQRVIHLPGDIIETNGEKQDGRTVRWEIDLRNRKAMEKTSGTFKTIGTNNAFALFDSSSLKFKLPLTPEILEPMKSDNVAQPKSSDPNCPGHYRVRIDSVSWNKKIDFVELKTSSSPSPVDIDFVLNWDKGYTPKAYKNPTLVQAFDEQNRECTPEKTFSSRQKISEYQSDSRFRCRIKMQSDSARKITSLQGYVDVVYDTGKRTVSLGNPESFVGKEKTGVPELDSRGVQIADLDKRKVKIKINDPEKTLDAVYVIDADGDKINTRSSSFTFMKSSTYEFESDISRAKELVFEFIANDKTVRVPFSTQDIPLP